MNIDIDSILSDEISDEAAYEVLSVFARLTSVIEARYYAQVVRYMDGSYPLELPKCLEEDEF